MPVFVQAQNSSNDQLTAVNGKKFYKHTVVKGETIYGIAQKFNLQPKDIVLQNPSAIDGVHPGDILLIPFVAAKPGDTSNVQCNCIYHDVLPKETLYSLAKQYNTTIKAIDSLNPDIPVKGLQKGQRIRIPIGQLQPVTSKTVVKPVVKDTLKIKPAVKQLVIKDTAKPIQQKPVAKKPAVKDTVKPAVTKPLTEVKKNAEETNAYKNLVVQETHPDTAKPFALVKDTGTKLSRYNIALIMPFANEGMDTLRLSHLMDGTAQVPQITQISVDFYHGIILALDSLAKNGFRANLHVYNILPGSDSSSHAVDSILKKPEMLQMNLIIGPPYPSNFKKVARFAGAHHIAIVSPLSTENSVLKNNPSASKTTPSTLTETEFEADYIAAHYSHANIILIHNRDASDEYYEIFKKRFKKTDSTLGFKDTLRHAESMGGVTGLKNKMVKDIANVIVMPYQGAPYIAKFVNELANSSFEKADSLILFGMHNWDKNDALAPDNMDTLNCHFTSNEFVNYADILTKKFIATYRNNYSAEPSYYSFEGYDAGMFYGNLLRLFGTDVQNHLGDSKYRGLQTSFAMSRITPASGYENKAVYIIEYKNYTEKLDSK